MESTTEQDMTLAGIQAVNRNLRIAIMQIAADGTPDLIAEAARILEDVEDLEGFYLADKMIRFYDQVGDAK